MDYGKGELQIYLVAAGAWLGAVDLLLKLSDELLAAGAISAGLRHGAVCVGCG